MANTTLLPGFRFHPTDEELIMYYLKRKVTEKLPSEAKHAIPELNVRHYDPWELPEKSRSKDLEWYFFCPIEKKYASGSRAKRANDTGFWKATGNDRTVTYKGRTVGKIKTLIFYQGQGRKAIRTNWVIHEYRMEDKHLADARIVQDSYVICKVFKKTGSGPQNGSQYGGQFNEEEWDFPYCEPDLSGVSPAMPAPTDCQSCLIGIESTSNFTLVEPGPSFAEPGPSSAEPGSSLAEPHINELPEGGDIIELLCPFFMEENGLPPIESNNNKNMSDLNQAECNDGDDIYNGLGGLGNLPTTLGEDGFSNIRNSWEETTAYYGDSDAYINEARSVGIAAECNDGDDMYNTLGDLGNLPTLGEDGFPNMTTAAAAAAAAYFGDSSAGYMDLDDLTAGYMDLDDLSKPIDESNCGSETPHLYPSYNDVEQSHNRGNTTSGSNPVPPEENIHPKGYNSW